MAESEAPDALVLDPTDNVAVAVRALRAGDEVVVVNRRVALADPIAFGHKFALEAIASGAPVRKYAEVIGIANAPIAPGMHVHVHNVVSSRLPGPEQEIR